MPPPPAAVSASPLEVAVDLPLRLAREEWNAVFESRYLEALLARYDNNITAAARAAGVNRVHFYRLLWKHGLREPDPNSVHNSQIPPEER